MRISDWSSVVCSSDLPAARQAADRLVAAAEVERAAADVEVGRRVDLAGEAHRSGEDVGDAIEAIVAREIEDAGAHLVERTGAREGAREIIIVRAVEDEAAVVDQIARELALGPTGAEREGPVALGRDEIGRAHV